MTNQARGGPVTNRPTLLLAGGESPLPAGLLKRKAGFQPDPGDEEIDMSTLVFDMLDADVANEAAVEAEFTPSEAQAEAMAQAAKFGTMQLTLKLSGSSSPAFSITGLAWKRVSAAENRLFGTVSFTGNAEVTITIVNPVLYAAALALICGITTTFNGHLLAKITCIW